MSLASRLHRTVPGAVRPVTAPVLGTSPRPEPCRIVPEWVRRKNEGGLPAKDLTARVLEP